MKPIIGITTFYDRKPQKVYTAVGVQWHPEDLTIKYPHFIKLFEALVTASGRLDHIMENEVALMSEEGTLEKLATDTVPTGSGKPGPDLIL